MQTYKNLNKNSSVKEYEYSDSDITVVFKEKTKKGFDTYTYSYLKPGRSHVEEMKQLADLGKGLGGYIGKNRDVFYGWISRS